MIHIHECIAHSLANDLPHLRWQSDWTRHQCVTKAQICSGYSPLLASYLHRTGRQDSATTSPYCDGAQEAAKHLILQCLTQVQLSQEILTDWANLQISSDPWCLWSYLEQIWAVTGPLSQPGMREREHLSWDESYSTAVTGKTIPHLLVFYLLYC